MLAWLSFTEYSTDIKTGPPANFDQTYRPPTQMGIIGCFESCTFHITRTTSPALNPSLQDVCGHQVAGIFRAGFRRALLLRRDVPLHSRSAIFDKRVRNLVLNALGQSRRLALSHSDFPNGRTAMAFFPTIDVVGLISWKREQKASCDAGK